MTTLEEFEAGEAKKSYVGPDIVPELDYVTICGVKVERPSRIERSLWLRFWEFRSWIV